MNHPSIMPKVEALLQSPKFWAATVPLATALALYQLGELDKTALANVIVIAAAISLGTVAIEEGLSQLFRILARPKE